MEGVLFNYAPGLAAFESGDLPSTRCVVLLGGLGDGFMTIPYTARLSTYLAKHGLSLVQILMRSSYSGYGVSSLQEDVECIIEAIRFLRDSRGKKEIVLLGHSTGCQDIMRLCSKWSEHAELLDGLLTKAVLQAPVSDREYMSAAYGDECRALVNWARGQDPDTIHPTERPPMSAYRILALNGRLGDDDFFSTDLTHQERLTKLKSVPIPILNIFSGNDEYFPCKEKMDGFLKSMELTWSKIERTVVLEGANHGITDTESQEIFFSSLVAFING